MSLGRRIASMRGFKTLTQEQLGALVGATKPTVSNWENDRRTPDADYLRAYGPDLYNIGSTYTVRT